jgi:hypothetical protein
MAPKYFVENRYSFVVDALTTVGQIDYEVDTPETAFERSVQHQLALANRLLMEGKHSAALARYRHLRGMIAAVIHPQISVANGVLLDWATLNKAELVDTVVARSVEMLKKTPVAESTVPAKLRGGDAPLPATIAKQFAVFSEFGVKDGQVAAGALIDEAEALVETRDFGRALQLFQSAMAATSDRELQGAVQHDIAVLQERTGNRAVAIESMQRAAGLLGEAANPERQVDALTALAGMQARGGSATAATATLKQADELRSRHSLIPIVTAGVSRTAFSSSLVREAAVPTTSRPVQGTISTIPGPVRPPIVRPGPIVAPAADFAPAAERPATAEEAQRQPVELMAATMFATRKTQKQLTILDGANKPQRVALDANGAKNLGTFYETIRTTSDLALLMGYLRGYTVTVAYLTHVYFWIIPMAIGDCFAALGSYAEAESEYLSTLNYRYMNQVVEAVNLWLRLAELYLDWGDRLYRQAGNTPAEFGRAKAKYELLLRLDNTTDANSPLYRSAQFAAMRIRVASVIQSVFVNGAATTENPRIVIALMRARMQLTKIAGQLNFIGLGVHTPPFSFEYLQNLARYFTQHASQVEQMYIQFQSTAENEQLREQQLAQQAAIADASVELEQRGLDEAREGIDVAQANLNATEVQRQNAQQAATDVSSVRWELLELDALQAWSSAAAVDEDDEVRQTITGFTYYSATKKDRSDVLFDLASQRTRITHDLEASRLQREINAANAYRGVAQQQVQQAQARARVAEQRVAIARMQAQHARENLEFLEGREFSSALWYNLARESRRLAQRYLDMAVEVATLMERAYEAETGRDLRKIKFEYGLNHLNGLLGAEALLLDIDFFSLDYVRTRSKKAQMKQSISLADEFPMAFERLLRRGRTFFQTELQQFDRRYPGFYLQKVKQVEVVFVGLNGNEGVHGTLRNIGVSQFRTKTGAIVNQTYPADVMPLSEYNVRQDAIVFQLDSKDLRLFENNGVATMWQLDLPLASNTFSLRQILDIQLVLYYDGFFDAGLEQQILAALPRSGSASRGLSLRLYAPDELFFLRSQGAAELRITPDLFPANQTNQRITGYTIQALGPNVANLRLQVGLAGMGATQTIQLDANGLAAGTAFPAPLNRTLFDTWTFTIDAGDNPGFDRAGLTDLALFVEYGFDYKR